jgi:exosome complex RNA-binding protein Csl4
MNLKRNEKYYITMVRIKDIVRCGILGVKSSDVDFIHGFNNDGVVSWRRENGSESLQYGRRMRNVTKCLADIFRKT